MIYNMEHEEAGHTISAGVSGVLALYMGSRVIRSGKLMPGLPIVTLASAAGGYSVMKLMQLRKEE